MVEFARVEEIVEASADAVWTILTDFGRPQLLAPTIDRCQLIGIGVGAIRIVESSSGLVIREELLECDRATYRFRYAVLGDGDMPFPHVRRYQCTVALTPLSPSRTEMTWRSEGEADGPLEPIGAYLDRLYRRACDRIRRLTAIDHILSDAVDRGVAPGLVGFVADRDGVLYEGAKGARLSGAAAPMTADTIFWIASMTKLVTTVAAVQMVERGMLSFDDPIADVLPELSAPQVLDGFDGAGQPILRPARGAITLRQLLTHRSGIAYELMNPELMRARGVSGPPPATALASLHGPLACDPGGSWEYGFGLDWVGLAIERRSGLPLDRYFAEHILGPLGMRDTVFRVPGSAADRCAGVHLRQADASVVPIPSPAGDPADWEFFSGGAGLFGTAGDYGRLLCMILNGGALDGVRVLRADSVNEMWSNQVGDGPAGRLRTAVPGLSLPYDPLPGQDGGWSLLGAMNLRETAAGRHPGSASWAGIAGTFFWIDRAADLCGVLMAQVLPFGDPLLRDVQHRFEAAAYADPRRRSAG